MCRNYGGWRLVALKEREKSNPTGDLQVATDGLLFDRHESRLTRRFVVYCCTAVYNKK
jgi:hypothetical protein